MPNPNSYSWNIGDSTSPTFVVEVVDGFTLNVIYSEPVVVEEALVVGNYSFNNGLLALSVLQVSDQVYRVATTQQSNISYTLTISNVHDLNGNLI